jgi:hypothetical protein
MGMRLFHSDHMASPIKSRTTMFCGRGGIRLPSAPSRAKQCISQCFPPMGYSVAAGRQSPEELKRLLDVGDTQRRTQVRRFLDFGGQRGSSLTSWRPDTSHSPQHGEEERHDPRNCTVEPSFSKSARCALI